MPTQPGQMLSHYRLVEKIGEGGMGVVWKAVDTKLDREVAIKTLAEELAADPERLGRFEREAKAVAALDHPNIVTVYSVEEAEGVHLITMGLVRGKSLTELIPRNGLPLGKFFDQALALADAISAAHQQGITHRDLKPDNVMIGDDGRLKVLDFGIAKLREEARAADGTQLPTATVTQEGKILGTVSYMSPEQAEGKQVDHRSDIFSLGVMLYQMATGQRPFKGDTSVSIISSIIKDTPASVTDIKSSLPRDLGRIVRRCLAKEPMDRFQSAIGLRSELVALKQELDSGEREPRVAAVSTASSFRRRWVLSATVLAVVVLLVWLGQLLIQQSCRDPDDRYSAQAVGAVERKRIVVLPFENLGPPEDEYFAAGMTEEITSRLAVVSGLGVISRTSAFQYDRTGKNIKQVGEDLGVDYVLEGTVRWARQADASRVRITPQLIRVADDTHLWAEAYERVIEDIFQVQSEIAGEVIEQLGVALLEPERRAIESKPTDNPEAYNAYLRGLHLMSQLDNPDRNLRLGIEMFRRAVELDPNFTLAYAELSEAHSVMCHLGIDRTKERLAMAKRAVERAAELAPDSPRVHVALGYYHYHGRKDYEGALEEFAIAEKGMPNNAELLKEPAWIYRRQGRWEEHLFNLERAFELDPLDGELQWNLAETYATLRRYADAESCHNRCISLAPDQVGCYVRQAELYWLWKGTTEEARAVLDEMPETEEASATWGWFWQEIYEGEHQAALKRLSSSSVDRFTRVWEGSFPSALLSAFAHDLLNEPELARRAYDSARSILEKELAQQPDDYRVHSALGMALAGLGRRDEAIREGLRGVELLPVSKDALWGPGQVRALALIYTMVGEHDAALDRIEYLLSIPSLVSIPYLRLDRRWEPLWDHPRFRELEKRFG